MATLGANAQVTTPRMQLLPSGFVGPDSINHYIVIKAAKKSKADLYKKTLTYLNSVYDNPGAVMRLVDGESITIKAETKAILGKHDFAVYNTSYNVLIEFKDGLIKFQPNIETLKEYITNSTPPKTYYVSSEDSPVTNDLNVIWVIDKKKNIRVLFHKEMKESADKWVNNYIASIVSKVNDTW
jgi:hypothetical protein